MVPDIKILPEPNPIPIATAIKIYANSSGSFIGALNLTIERDPINPRDSAKDDLTVIIIKKVIDDIIGKARATWFLEEIVFEYLVKKDFVYKEKIIHKNNETIAKGKLVS